MGLCMKRGRLPLTALRAFEAAGRLGSFTLAAAELYISQAAVSRQVRELEAVIGGPLFERRHRSVALTPAGDQLCGVLTHSFDEIGECLDQIGARGVAAPASVSSDPSFAICWLVPHLAGFRRDHPEIDVDLDSDARLIAFRRHEASLAIRYSLTATQWPGAESQHLYDVRLTPVLSPGALNAGPRLTGPADLLGHVLLHEERRDIWPRWFESAGIATPGVPRGFVYADGGLTLQAALQGQGVALVDERLASEAINKGRLVRPFDLSISYGAYWLVAKRFDALAPSAALFARWIERNFRSGSPNENGAPEAPRGKTG